MVVGIIDLQRSSAKGPKMSKKEELNWRLSNLPTVEELRDLVKDKIITQEEAREILFRTETIEDKDIKSLETEVKFLKELVERLSMGYTSPVTIGFPRYYQKLPFIGYYSSTGTLGNVQLTATNSTSWVN